MKTTGNIFSENRPLRMRWVMIGFAFLATVLNYVHRLSFNYLSADGELRRLIPDDAFGYIGTAFFIGYMLSNAFSGIVIDKLGTKIGYSLCMAFWTTAGLLHAFVITPLQFGICRFLLGVGEAGNWPAALKLTGEWFPPEERSTAAGIFNSGSAIGAIIVPPLVAIMGIRYGWQSTFIILAVFGYLWLAAFWFSYHTPGKSAKETMARVVPPSKLLKSKFVSMLLLAKIFIEPVWYFVTFWIGRYLADVHNWDLKQIGWFAMIPFIMADLGNIIGGYFTQFIIRRGVPIPKARRIAIAVSGVLMAMPLLIAPLIVTTPMSALIVFGLSGFGYTSYTANALALTADVVPKSSAASAWGLSCIGNGIGGAIFQALSGLTLVTFSAKLGYSGAYHILFLGFGIMVVIGVLILLYLSGPFVRDKALEEYANGEQQLVVA
ncbi:MAG TPA: MFS transporter [Niabella sp.]|nr:MFS transporter [Niabella sp.]HQW16364.1 MFS transporter [Niabella sp.]HQX21616.1 MFS transporter [Niabella sp.]HRB07195.1 MFS transporter [Niabella sp.]HRB37215.1 MFS transporter [Niabella sp.]